MTGNPIFAGLKPRHFAAILADPPVDFRTWGRRRAPAAVLSVTTTRCGLTILSALPVGDLAADDCALFLQGLFDNGPVRTRRQPSTLKWGISMDRFGMVPVRVYRDRRIRERGQRVFGAICGRAGPDPDGVLDPDHFRVAFARNEELAEDTDIDRRGIAVETRKLQSAEYIWIVRGWHGGRGTKYIVLMSCPDVNSCPDMNSEQPKVTSPRAKPSRPDVQNVTPRRDPYTESRKNRDSRSLRERVARARPRESASHVPKNQQGHLKLPINGGATATSAKQFHHGGSNEQTRIPPDWSPSGDDREYARRRAGWDDQRIDLEVDDFRNYYLAHPGPVLTDCSRGWCGWVGRADQFNNRHRGTAGSAGPRRQGTVANVRELMSRRGMGTRQAGD